MFYGGCCVAAYIILMAGAALFSNYYVWIIALIAVALIVWLVRRNRVKQDQDNVTESESSNNNQY